ncbi:MAG: HAMP domain-containing histidine kinase, partial [Mailhella sp.]|nr:HAMP domain-containing histidine kinase [Mailhella sp.]
AQSSRRLEFAITPLFPDENFTPGTTGPILHAQEFFSASFPPGHGPLPPMMAGFSRNQEHPGLLIAVQLNDGNWLVITRMRATTLRQEKIQHGVFFAQFLVFFLLMFCLLFRETRQLEKLRRDVEHFGNSPENMDKLSEEGCREIRETARSLNRMRERVQGSIEERDRMLSALRHDLRTPLTRLKLWAEESEPEAVRDKLLENANQIRDMVTQSIELASSLNTTEKEVQLDLAAFVESIVDDYRDEGRRVALAEDMPSGLTFRTRPICLRRCLSNLIENALKYAGDAEIALYRTGSESVIEVRDTGPGIPPDKLEKVLEPWFRVENSRNRETGGSGLGLAIAKNMASLSGASLSLYNRKGGGLCARLHFKP